MTLTERQKTTFDRLADLLIPASPPFPSASEAQVGDRWLSKVLAARPDLEAPLIRALGHPDMHGTSADLETLAREDRASFCALAVAVAGAYFLNPRVKKLYAYPGQRPQPWYPDAAEFYLRGAMLDPVQRRGSRYRRVGSASK